MLFAGHVAVVFLANHVLASFGRHRDIFAHASLVCLVIASLVPDLDFVFYDIVGHHTISHSVTFWSIVYLPFFLRWGLKMLPYYIATLSHLLGDIILGNPPLLYGISDMRFGLFYDHAISTLDFDQFMLARSLLDFSAVICLFTVRDSVFSVQRMFSSDREIAVALPILAVLVVSIFIASNLQDKVFFSDQEHDWPVFIAAYSILTISHVIVLLIVIAEARLFLSKKEDPIRRL